MKKFLFFVRKEFFHILRDRRTMLILLGMPIVQIVLFGFAISVEIRGINIAIVAPKQSETINEITRKIDANQYFKVLGVYSTEDEAEAMLKKGDIDMILRFQPDFDRRISLGDASAQISVDASNPNNSAAEQMYLQQIVSSYFAEKNAGISIAAPISTNLRLLYNPRMESSYNFVPGIMGLIMIIICAMMTSVSIVREKEVGTMEVLLVSPVRPITIIIAKMVPYFALSCINLAVILLLARFLLNVPLAGSLLLICAISIIYILISLVLGMLISTLVQTQMAAMLCSAMVLMLPVLLLSGMIFPIECAPHSLQWISCIIPARWYISAMRKLMIEGLPFKYVITELSVLLGMGIALFSIALANFKNRL